MSILKMSGAVLLLHLYAIVSFTYYLSGIWFHWFINSEGLATGILSLTSLYLLTTGVEGCCCCSWSHSVTHTHTHTHNHTHTHKHTHIHTLTNTHTHTHSITHSHTHTHTHKHTQSHTHIHRNTHTHTHSVGLLVARNSACRKHNIHKQKTSVNSAGFEPAIAATKQRHTHALDRSATGLATET
jgi:hypothetical protein